MSIKTPIELEYPSIFHKIFFSRFHAIFILSLTSSPTSPRIAASGAPNFFLLSSLLLKDLN
jgi:hypothetical protein